MLLQLPKKDESTTLEIAGSYFLPVISNHLRDLHTLLSLDIKELTDKKLHTINQEKELLDKYRLIVPTRMIGIDGNKLSIYLEDQITEQIKNVIKKIFHYLFAGIKETYTYINDEIDKFETIGRKINTLKKGVENFSAFNKESFSNKVVTVWDSTIFIDKIDAVKKIIGFFNAYDKSSTTFTDQFNEQLSILKYEIKDSKIVALASEDMTKDRLGDLKWTKEILLANMKKMSDILNDRKIFDAVVKKMKELEKATKDIENNQDHKDEKEIQKKLETIRTEYNFITKLKDIILEVIYKLALQLVMIGNNAIAAK